MEDGMISVIIPVYNGERFLRETLQSVKKQKYKNFEVIVIDDGSTDSTEEILTEFLAEIQNMAVIFQTNSGVSVARNNGLKRAKGDIIIFLDADDILHPEFLQQLQMPFYDDNVDVVVCNYMPFYGKNCIFTDTGDKQEIRLRSIYKEKTFEYLMKEGVGTALWNKAFRRSLLVDSGISFNPQLSFGEDMFFNWKACLVSKEIVYIPKMLYGYRLSNGSAISKYHAGVYEKYCQEYDDLESFAERFNKNSPDFQELLMINLAERIPTFLRMNARSGKSLKEKYCYISFLCGEVRIRRAVETALSTEGKHNSVLMQIYHSRILYLLLKSVFEEIITKAKNLVRCLW